MAKTAITTARSRNAVSVVAAPATGTSSHAPAQSRPKSASVGILLRPREKRAIGSCATMITTVFTRNRSPMLVSERPASFFA